MPILSDLEKIESKEFTRIFLVLISLISPGILVIFHFYNQLFLELDFFKLVIFSISLITPMIFLNFITVSFLDIVSSDKSINKKSEESKSLDKLYILISLTVIFTSFIIYPSLFISIFYSLAFSQFINITISASVLIFIISAILSKIYSK